MTSCLRQARVALAAQHLREVLAVDPLHHQVAPGRVVDHAEHLDHARMVQPAQQPPLDLEARGVALVEQSLGRDAAAIGVRRLVDAAHRSLGHRRSEPVAADELRARRWSVHRADGTAAAAAKTARDRFRRPWRKLGGAVACAQGGSVGDPAVRSCRGQQQRRADRRGAARAPGPAAVRLPRLPPDARLPALRARGRAVAEGRARVVGFRALLAAVEAAPRARAGRAGGPR